MNPFWLSSHRVGYTSTNVYFPGVRLMQCIRRKMTANILGSGTFALFACACFGAYLWATHLVPETGGVALEEIDAVFGGEAGKADVDLRREVCA